MRTILETPAVQRRKDRFGPTQHFLVVLVTAASMLVSTAGVATAASATPGPSTLQTATPRTLQQPTYLGIGTLGALGAAQVSNGFTDGTTDATSLGTGKNNRTVTKDASSGIAPDPVGLTVTSAGTFSGFSGLTHADQRLAGTGVYTNTQFSLEPPDQGLCVGGGFVVESVNDAFRVFDTHGKALSATTAFNQFFGVAPAIIRTTTPPTRGDFLSDPKCNYDVATRRWFMSILQVDAPGLCSSGPPFNATIPCHRAHTFLAVSQSPDPTGHWSLFSIDATDDGLNGTPNNSTSTVVCPCFGDQPLLGLNADAVFISTNEYGTPTLANTDPGNPEIGGQIYVISKRALEQATSGSLPTVVHLNVGALRMPASECCRPWDSIQPATSPTAAGQTSGFEFFMSSFTNNPQFSDAINVWAVTGTNTLGSGRPDVDIHRAQVSSEVYGYDRPFGMPGLGTMVVTQKDGPRPLGAALGNAPLPQINANDVRMNQVVYADHKLWAGLNTALASPANAPRAGIAYFVVKPDFNGSHLSADMAAQGYVSAAGESTIFPSIGVNEDGNGAIAFSLIGPDYFPSAAYVRITSNGQLAGDIVVAGAGTAPDDGFTGYTAETGLPPVGRWGDYSAALATPDGTIWMAAEYIPAAARTILANWGTFVTRIQG